MLLNILYLNEITRDKDKNKLSSKEILEKYYVRLVRQLNEDI